MKMAKLYDWVGSGVAKVNDQNAIGLSFPVENPPHPDDPGHDANFEDVFLTLPAAKALLVDLRDAIDCTVDGREFLQG